MTVSANPVNLINNPTIFIKYRDEGMGMGGVEGEAYMRRKEIINKNQIVCVCVCVCVCVVKKRI